MIAEFSNAGVHMKKRKKQLVPVDTPATRKERLQQRLKELTDHSEQELATLMNAVEKAKSALRSNKPSGQK